MGSFRDIGAALGRAERSRVLIALRCSMLTFPASAVGVRAGLGPPLPLGPITSLQLSSMFAKLVTPTGLGSTAMDVRVMQRRGVDTTSAITSDVAISLVSGLAELLSSAYTYVMRRGGSRSASCGRIALLVVIVGSRRRGDQPGAKAASCGRAARAAGVEHERAAGQVAEEHVADRRLRGGRQCLVRPCLGLCVRAHGGKLRFATLVLVSRGATALGGLAPVAGGLGRRRGGLVAS